MSLKQQLRQLRPKFAAAAQAIYDSWEQDEDGFDEEFGGGGICDAIANAIMGLMPSGIDTMDGGQPGDEHAFVIAFNDTEACTVDIPPGVYESGGGYNWKKRQGVTITEDDVEIIPINRSDIEPEDY